MSFKRAFRMTVLLACALGCAAVLFQCGGSEGTEDAGGKQKACKISDDCFGGGTCVGGFCQGGTFPDAGQAADAGGDAGHQAADGGGKDGGAPADAGHPVDGSVEDGGTALDGGQKADGGTQTDGGYICGALNCQSGCCDTHNTCQGGNSDKLCGKNGTACDDCTSTGDVCKFQQCTATTSCTAQCQGCCDLSAQCQTGNSDSTCGNGGDSCVDCTTMIPPGTCSAGVCKGTGTCNYMSCTLMNGGCCDTNGVCQDGRANNACGKTLYCIDCTKQGKQCVNQVCGTPSCNQTSCPDGCCELALDKCWGGNAQHFCGKGSAPCVDCSLLDPVKVCYQQQCI
jgi:hypothetical protein